MKKQKSSEVTLDWISWKDHPVPDDIKGILIKYEQGVFSDRYDIDTGKRKYNGIPIGWKFMERRCPNEKTIKANTDFFGMKAFVHPALNYAMVGLLGHELFNKIISLAEEYEEEYRNATSKTS